MKRVAFLGLAAATVMACVHYTATSSPPVEAAGSADQVPIPAPPPPPPLPPAHAGYAGYRDAVDQLRSRCDSGQLGGCTALGLLYWNGTIVSRDREQARRLLRKACEGGDSGGCTAAAELAAAATGEEAPAVVNPGSGSTVSVFTSDQVYVDGKQVLQSSQGADATGVLNSLVATFQKECAAGNQQGCVALGLDYWEGNFVPQDRAKARQLLQGACDAGDKGGCKVLAALDGEAASGGTGDAVVVTPGASVAVVDSGGAQSLSTGAVSGLLTGVIDMLQKSCNAGTQQACVSLAMFYWKGRIVAPDRAKARQLLQSACGAGDQTGCAVLQRLERSSP